MEEKSFIESCMSYEPNKNFKNKEWLMSTQYESIDDILTVLGGIPEFEYQKLFLFIFENVNLSYLDDQTGCDNCFIVDGKNALYVTKNNPSAAYRNLVNVVRLNSEDFTKYLKDEPKVEQNVTQSKNEEDSSSSPNEDDDSSSTGGADEEFCTII